MEAGTLFFEIFGPEGRQAFSRPPAFAHALAEAKGGGQPFRVATQGAWPNLAFLPCLGFGRIMPRLCGGCPERRVVSLGAFWSMFD